MAVNCPNCDAVLDIEEDELDEGETVPCDECGGTFKVASKDPLELESADDDDDEDEDFDEDDEDDDFDEDEEEEDEDDDWE
jgi:alpha-aminoadipate carrier protein LysW